MLRLLVTISLCAVGIIHGFNYKRISSLSKVQFDRSTTSAQMPFSSKFQLFDKNKITRENEDKQYFESEFDRQPIKER